MSVICAISMARLGLRATLRRRGATMPASPCRRNERGRAGAARMPTSPEFRAHVFNLLEPLGHVEAKRMFGGVGFFYRGLMFALIAGDVLHLRIDEASRGAYEAAGSGPFTYKRAGVDRAIGSYWRVPDEVLEDEASFVAWARRAAEAALAAERAKAGKVRRPRAR
jgi:DNA transformation protein